MSWHTKTFEELFTFQKKSKRKASAGKAAGDYAFYTSSPTLSKYTNEPDYNKSSLVFGTGGNASVHLTSEKFSTSGDCLVATPKHLDELCLKFAFYFFVGNIQVLEEGFKGAGLKHISKAYISKIEIPLPPLAIQKQIAAVLEKANTLRGQSQQMEHELNTLAQSLFLNDVGDECDDFSKWPEKALESLCHFEKGSIRTGPFGSDLKHSEFVDDGYPVIGIDNAVDNKFKWKERRFVTEEKYQKLKRYTVKPKDIIITIMGTVGRVAVIPDDIPTSISTKHLAVLSINDQIALPEFVADAFRFSTAVGRQIKRKNKGAIMDGLNLSIIKSLIIKLPPLETQNSYLKKKNKLNNSKLHCELQIKQLDDNFNSLMQRAFKGELELKDVV